MKLPYRWLFVGCGVAVAGVLTAFALSPFGRGIIYFLFAKRNVPFDQPRLEAVVEEVKARGIKPGEELLFRLDNPKDAKSLRPRARDERIPRGRGAGNVWAAREPDGPLIVIIETSDWGHAGEYGYAYSEVRPHKTSDGRFALGDLEDNLICTDPHADVAKNWWDVENCYMN